MSTTIGRRRYLTNFQTHRLPHLFTDVIVLGSGAAGLQAALAAAEHADVLLITKDTIEHSTTAYAQGGIAAAILPGDSPAQHAADTVGVGRGLGHPDLVNRVTEAGPAAIKRLEELGARFDRADGHLLAGREGGHTQDRIIHAHDATGRAILAALIKHVRQHPRIRIFDHCFAIDLLTHEGHAVGVITHHAKYGHQMFWATTTILATGGCGRVYRETTNPPVASGDGLALALRAGAALRDIEMVQFHPTTLYVAGAARALISEAVRGDGAYLLNRAGERFMSRYDERGELAPRDVVSRAITAEMKAEDASSVFLDVRHFAPGHFAERFPNIYKHSCEVGLQPEQDLIPVRPSAHYLIGGVVVDEQGQTTLPGLLACGEVTSSGLHGANRLASNSLLETIVFGQRAGELAGERTATLERIHRPLPVSHLLPLSPRTQLDLVDVANSLASLMSRNVAVERSGDRLRETVEIVEFWARYVLDKVFNTPRDWEIQNMLTCAYCITLAAATRCESRGVHFRTDFPHTDEQWHCHIELQRVDDTIQASTRAVPANGGDTA